MILVVMNIVALPFGLIDRDPLMAFMKTFIGLPASGLVMVIAVGFLWLGRYYRSIDTTCSACGCKAIPVNTPGGQSVWAKYKAMKKSPVVDDQNA
jgi:hypothetical protein